MPGGSELHLARRPRKQGGDVVLAEDRRFKRAGLGVWLQPKLANQQRAKSAVGLERFVRSTHRIQGEHLRPVGALAEAIQSCGGLSKAEACPKVAHNQRGVGGFEVSPDNASA